MMKLIDKESMDPEYTFELYSYPYDKLKFFLLDRPRHNGFMIWHDVLEYDTSNEDEDLDEDDYPWYLDDGNTIGWLLEGIDTAKEGTGSALAQLLYKFKKLKKP